MKKITYRFAAVLLAATTLATACNKSDSGNCSQKNAPSANTLQTARIANGVAVQAMAGGYSDLQNCLRNYGDCAWCVTDNAYTGLDNQMPVEISFLSDTRMKVRYLRALASSDNTTIDLTSDVVLPASLCTKLDVRSAVIKAGSYSLNTTLGQYGGLVVSVQYVN